MKATTILQVRKVKCQWCNGMGNIPTQVRTMTEPDTSIVLDPCPSCGGYGYNVKPKRPSQLNVSGRPPLPKNLKPSKSLAEARLYAAIRAHDKKAHG